jgi:DNA-binding LacI/PurR family transcriptional regulator
LSGSRVTANDVAQLAGVSQSAVSRAFTPGASVGAVTRARVLKAAEQLGYSPNALARGLITGRSRIIGLVVSQLENLFYPAVVDQLCRELQERGYRVLMFMGDREDADELVAHMLQYRVDGIIFGAATLSSALAQRCTSAGIPVVLFNRVMARSRLGSRVCSVRGDNTRGARSLAEHLLQGGHCRIAFIAGREDSSTNLERERGFIDGLSHHGQRLFARAVGNYDPSQAACAARALFSGRSPLPDAVFAASDQMALAVMDTLRFELGLRVPEDVSVVGFDDVPQASWLSYQLTSWQQPVAPMVRATVDLIESQLHEGLLRPRNLIVKGRLCVRSSSMPKARISVVSNRLRTGAAYE